jgi:hypothetical protein
MPSPTGPACGTCGAPAVVHWQRRLDAGEIAAEQAKEQTRRDDAVTAHRQLVNSLAGTTKHLPPEPQFGPLPDHADSTTVVHACKAHAIDRDAAARIHQSTCTGCDCTPEPPPEPVADPEQPDLPDGW